MYLLETALLMVRLRNISVNAACNRPDPRQQ